jgi:hypothetical protein
VFVCGTLVRQRTTDADVQRLSLLLSLLLLDVSAAAVRDDTDARPRPPPVVKIGWIFKKKLVQMY